MSLLKVEGLFQGETELLVWLVERLIQDGKKMEAKGIYLRNKLKVEDFGNSVIPGKNGKQGFAKDLEKMNYDASRDVKPPMKDMFEPISLPSIDYLRFPKDIQVDFIDREKDLKKLEVLVGQEYVGVDSEWRP